MKNCWRKIFKYISLDFQWNISRAVTNNRWWDRPEYHLILFTLISPGKTVLHRATYFCPINRHTKYLYLISHNTSREHYWDNATAERDEFWRRYFAKAPRRSDWHVSIKKHLVRKSETSSVARNVLVKKN